MSNYASKGTSQSASWAELRRLASDLAPGEQRAGLRCIFCGGGSSKEHSLSLSRISDSEALYCCHRASCGKSGRVACWGFRLEPSEGSTNTADRRKQASPVYNGTVHNVASGWNAFLLQRYGLREEETTRAGWGQDLDTGGLVIPIFDRRAVRIGTELRKSYLSNVSVGPKTKLYFNETSNRPGWYRTITPGGPVVLVEDAISALKVSRHFSTVALFGTHLNHERLSDILEEGCRDIIIALDKDATEKAFNYQRKFGIYGNFKVAILENDLKYEDDDRINEIITKAI